MIHRIEVISSLDRTKHWAKCSCGYVGPMMTNKFKAEQDGDEHVIAVGRSETEEE